MHIRESTEQDKPFIKGVHFDAFDEEERESVSQLALDLLDDETAQPLLSLVAEKNGIIVGHILFTAIKVNGEAIRGAYILAPLAVARNLHRSGIGSALIDQGLELLKQRGGQFCLVLGDPNYYSRAGFKIGHKLKAPYTLQYPEAWMAQELQKGRLKNIAGTVECAVSLNAPEHW